MKKGLFLLLGILVFIFVIPEINAQPIVLKAVTAFPKTHLNNDPVGPFVDAVNKRAAGRLKIEWVGGPEVSASFDQIHAIISGVGRLGCASASKDT